MVHIQRVLSGQTYRRWLRVRGNDVVAAGLVAVAHEVEVPDLDEMPSIIGSSLRLLADINLQFGEACPALVVALRSLPGLLANDVEDNSWELVRLANLAK
ncbi:MAG: hypothetical protein ACKPKO_01220, partial [Candidatus Fonsibacter sp.]